MGVDIKHHVQLILACKQIGFTFNYRQVFAQMFVNWVAMCDTFTFTITLVNNTNTMICWKLIITCHSFITFYVQAEKGDICEENFQICLSFQVVRLTVVVIVHQLLLYLKRCKMILILEH